ncbi:DUF2970 domain-containing protein [Marinimicrobium sp. ARAG 43.8]|uniref:DUF2970 domain-containing protein n=1 Tax=Marinimicrobium sp. ARAG 43.8 TaxID=3418719 RepID=UPI003CEDF078
MASSKQQSDVRASQAKSTKRAGKPGFFQIVLSTLAAAFGVQSNRNRERDFSHGSIFPYIAAGVIFTVLFVVAVIFLVRLVLHTAGA